MSLVSMRQVRVLGVVRIGYLCNRYDPRVIPTGAVFSVPS